MTLIVREAGKKTRKKISCTSVKETGEGLYVELDTRQELFISSEEMEHLEIDMVIC